MCTAARRADDLNHQILDAVNGGQIPPAFEEDLTSRANELVNEVNCPPPVQQPTTESTPEEDRGKGRGKKKGHEKGKTDTGLLPGLVDTVTTSTDTTEDGDG